MMNDLVPMACPLSQLQISGLLSPPANIQKIIPVIGHENAHAQMSAFLAIISAIFTKLLQLKWSETNNCI